VTKEVDKQSYLHKSTVRGTLRSIELKRIPVVFYRTEAGNEPVRAWLKSMENPEDRRLIGEDIRTVEFGWPMGMPTCRPMGDGLHEVRIYLPGNRTSRVFFYVDKNQRMVLLHGILKKTRATPPSDFGPSACKQAETCKGINLRIQQKKPFDHTGSSFDSFLEEEGILDEVDAVAVKRVIAWQLAEAMKAGNISKKAMAERLGTSRSQLDRLLDPQNSAVHLETIAKAARAVGKRLRMEMVDAA